MTWRGMVVECPKCLGLRADTMEEDDGDGPFLLCECLDCGHEWELATEPTRT